MYQSIAILIKLYDEVRKKIQPYKPLMTVKLIRMFKFTQIVSEIIWLITFTQFEHFMTALKAQKS